MASPLVRLRLSVIDERWFDGVRSGECCRQSVPFFLSFFWERIGWRIIEKNRVLNGESRIINRFIFGIHTVGLEEKLVMKDGCSR